MSELPVIRIAIAMILAHLFLRGSTLARGWFFGDDFGFLHTAKSQGLSWDYLFTPYNGHLMPGGILMSWVGSRAEAPFPWGAWAVEILVFQAVCDFLLLWALIRLFGSRPGILMGLGVYLFSAIGVHTAVWWSSAIIELPAQATAFAMVGLYAQWRLTRRHIYLVACVACFVVGLFFHLRTLTYLPVLPVLALGYFATGTFRARLKQVFRADGLLFLVLGAISASYIVYYLMNVPMIVDNRTPHYLGTFDHMLRDSVLPGLLGGPWWWRGVGVAIPPAWAMTLAWVAAALLVRQFQRGARTWWAITMLLIHIAAASFLVAATKSSAFGAEVGASARYGASSIAVAGLAIPLAFLALRDHRSNPIDVEIPTFGPPERTVKPWLRALLVTTVLLGYVISSWPPYLNAPGKATRAFAHETLKTMPPGKETVEIANVELPPAVYDKFWFPANYPSFLFAQVDRIKAVTVGQDIRALTHSGKVVPAVVAPDLYSVDRPADSCGFALQDSAPEIKIPLTGEPPGFFWWISVSYLASKDGVITVRTSAETKEAPIKKGLHTLFLQSGGPQTPLAITSKTRGLALCIDKVAIGSLTAPAPKEQ